MLTKVNVKLIVIDLTSLLIPVHLGARLKAVTQP